MLTPVGMLPFAAAGIDIEAVMAGAAAAYQACSFPELEANECYQYAALRQIFYNRGKTVELLVSYEPALHYLAEWWKQLFGESEGKDGKGLFPAACDFTTDLHSLGQYIQDGRRLFFETVLRVENPGASLEIPGWRMTWTASITWPDGTWVSSMSRSCAGRSWPIWTGGPQPDPEYTGAYPLLLWVSGILFREGLRCQCLSFGGKSF